MNNKRGFSLIELMVVVAIIAIISAIAIPMYNKYRAKSYQNAAITAAREWMSAFSAAYAGSETRFMIDGDTNNYECKNASSYQVPTYEDSTRDGTCSFQVESEIDAGVISFTVYDPNSAKCYDLASKDGDLWEFKKTVLEGKNMK